MALVDYFIGGILNETAGRDIMGASVNSHITKLLRRGCGRNDVVYK